MPHKLTGWLASLILMMLVLLPVACQPQPRSPTTASSPSSGSPAALVQETPTPPAINPKELLRHLETLSFERYRDRDRQRARTYLTETLTRYGWQPKLQRFEHGGINLIATYPGNLKPSPANKRLLVVAHYDSMLGSPGADDNATAVAAALEIARLFARSLSRPLEIVFFDQEERGLLGSIAFTAKPENLKDLAGVINLEMLGYACNQPGCQHYPEGLPVTPPSDRGDFLAVVGDQEHPELLAAFADQSAQPPVMTVPIPFKGILTPDVLRSDHAPFWAQNIGAVMVTDTAYLRNPYYHQPSDTPATLNQDFFVNSVQQVVNAVTRLLIMN